MKIFEFEDSFIDISDISTAIIGEDKNEQWKIRITTKPQNGLNIYFETEILAREKYNELISAIRGYRENI